MGRCAAPAPSAAGQTKRCLPVFLHCEISSLRWAPPLSGDVGDGDEFGDGDAQADDATCLLLEFRETEFQETMQQFIGARFQILPRVDRHLAVIVLLAAGVYVAGTFEAADVSVKARADVVEFVEDVMGAASLNGVVGALAAMRDRVDSTPMLGDIAVPVLILHGADDQLIPVAEAEAMFKAIPNAELVIVPDAGHLPNLEQPDIFNDAVIDFLEEIFGEDDEDE